MPTIAPGQSYTIRHALDAAESLAHGTDVYLILDGDLVLPARDDQAAMDAAKTAWNGLSRELSPVAGAPDFYATENDKPAGVSGIVFRGDPIVTGTGATYRVSLYARGKIGRDFESGTELFSDMQAQAALEGSIDGADFPWGDDAASYCTVWDQVEERNVYTGRVHTQDASKDLSTLNPDGSINLGAALREGYGTAAQTVGSVLSGAAKEVGGIAGAAAGGLFKGLGAFGWVLLGLFVLVLVFVLFFVLKGGVA